MKKYQIDKSFKIFRYFLPPTNKFFAYLANYFLKLLPKKMKSNNLLLIKKIRIKNKNIKLTNYLIVPKSISNNKNIPLIVYIHGGGFIYEAAPYHYLNVKNYSLNSNSAVLFLNYRVIKEYPSSIDDICFGFNQFFNNLKEFNLDKSNIIFAGDSAGAFLILKLLEKLKDSEIEAKGLMLIYPFIKYDKDSVSMKKYVDTPMWNAKCSKRIVKSYFKGEMPLFDKDIFFNLPKYIYIETCEYDCLHDQGVELAKRLIENKKEVVLNDIKNTMHGYDIVSSSPITKSNLFKRYEFLKNTFLK